MADRDEGRDVGVIEEGLAFEACPWENRDGDYWTRYVPHSDLEAAEREIARLQGQLELRDREVANLGEGLRHIRTSLEAAEQSIRAAVGHTYPF
jgi:hypothetical protein